MQLLYEFVQVVHIAHLGRVQPIEEGHSLLAVEPLALEKLQLALVGGPGEPVLQGRQIGVEAIARVSVQSVLEVLDGLLLSALLSHKVEAQDGIVAHRRKVQVGVGAQLLYLCSPLITRSDFSYKLMTMRAKSSPLAS